MKDFEYLKFMNQGENKDSVLEEFIKKAEEMEIAAGPTKNTINQQPTKTEMVNDAIK